MTLPGALDVLLAALALWRLSAMLSYERGPLRIFVRLRERLGILHDEDGTPAGYDETRYLAGLVFCCWCLSVNIAIPLAALWLAAPDVARVVCLPLALSAGAIVVERLVHNA